MNTKEKSDMSENKNQQGIAAKPDTGKMDEPANNRPLVTYYKSGRDKITEAAIFILERRRKVLAQQAEEGKTEQKNN